MPTITHLRRKALSGPRKDGVVCVANIEMWFELLSENEMDDRVIASIVPLAGRFHMRGEKEIYCVAGN